MKKFDDLQDTIKDLMGIIDKTVEWSTFDVANAFLDDSNYYVPMSQEVALRNSSVTWSALEKGHLEWRTPYARRLFYNPQYNFSKDVNPNASGLWAEKAKAEGKDKYKTITNNNFKKAKEVH